MIQLLDATNELLASIRSLMDQIGDLIDRDPDQEVNQISEHDLQHVAALCLEVRDNVEALDADLTEGGWLPADWSDATTA